MLFSGFFEASANNSSSNWLNSGEKKLNFASHSATTFLVCAKRFCASLSFVFALTAKLAY